MDERIAREMIHNVLDSYTRGMDNPIPVKERILQDIIDQLHEAYEDQELLGTASKL